MTNTQETITALLEHMNKNLNRTTALPGVNQVEEMKKDLPEVIRKTAAFLDKSLSEEDVAKLAEHLAFKNMKNNKAVNKEDFNETMR